MEDFLKHVGLVKKSKHTAKSAKSIVRPFSDQFYYKKPSSKRSRTLGLPLSFLATIQRRHAPREHRQAPLRAIVCKDYEKYCSQSLVTVPQVKRKRRPLAELRQSSNYAAGKIDEREEDNDKEEELNALGLDHLLSIMKPCIVRVKPISMAEVQRMLKSSSSPSSSIGKELDQEPEKRGEEEEEEQQQEENEENRPPTTADQSSASGQATATDTTTADLDRRFSAPSRLKRRIERSAMLVDMLGESNFEISSSATRNTSEYDDDNQQQQQQQIEIIDLTMDDDDDGDEVVVNSSTASSSTITTGGTPRAGGRGGFFDKWTKQRKAGFAASIQPAS